MRIGGGKTRRRGAKGLALLHTLQDEIDPMAMGALDATLRRTNIILLAHLRLRPFDGNIMIACERLDPVPILIGPPREHRFVDHRLAYHVVEEMRHLPRTRQPAQIAVNHHPVETVVYKQKQAAKQPGKHLHRSSLPCSCLSNKIIGQTTGGFKISNIFG